LDVSPTVFEILTLKAKNGLFSPSLPYLTRPLEGNSLEFLDETRETGLPYGEKFIIITSTVFDLFTRVTDGQTDGRTDKRTD